VGFAWPPTQKLSPTIREQAKKFAATVKLAALVYDNVDPEEQLWLCEGLLQISQEIASEGYLTKYGVYTTEEQKRGCVLAFWPSQIPHNGKFRVPRRFADPMAKKFERRMGSDHEAATC
jgi:hypothetical protein